MKRYLKYGCLLLPILMSSCLKKETPIQPFERGHVVSATVEMGSDYRYQVYYHLKNEQIVSTNLKTDWDLAFSSDPGKSPIVLNAAKFVLVAKTGESDFNTITTADSLRFMWDDPTGDLSKTAFGDWEKNKVYVIDRGQAITGLPLGYKKMMINDFGDEWLEIRLADLDGSNDHHIRVEKDNNRHLVHLSFEGSGEQPEIEPLKNEWDLLFTQHMNVFYVDGDTLPYLVTGVISNIHSQVEVAIDSVSSYPEIGFSDIPGLEFSQAANAIGYDWKYYDFDNSTFEVLDYKNYIIRDTEGFYFKLRFIDFYNSYGDKGSPTFEYKLL